jgi:hypothetical protein
MIWTLDAIKKEMDEVAGQWNGDESGKQEEDAQTAIEILEHVARIEELLEQLDYTVTKNYKPL